MAKKYQESVGDVGTFDEDEGIVWISSEEGAKLLDRRSQEYFGISGDEFRERFENGEFDVCDAQVNLLYYLLPLAEQ